MFAHSLKLVLPRMTAPASRNFCATNESLTGREPTSANDPAVVCIRSAVSMLSLISTGIPCRGPRAPLAFRSLSRPSAIARASGLSSMTLFTAGPRRSISSIRCLYFSVKERRGKFSRRNPRLKVRNGEFVQFEPRNLRRGGHARAGQATSPHPLRPVQRSAGNADVAQRYQQNPHSPVWTSCPPCSGENGSGIIGDPQTILSAALRVRRLFLATFAVPFAPFAVKGFLPLPNPAFLSPRHSSKTPKPCAVKIATLIQFRFFF